jgi:hypothetical protein
MKTVWILVCAVFAALMAKKNAIHHQSGSFFYEVKFFLKIAKGTKNT